jgi:hypothetical protein
MSHFPFPAKNVTFMLIGVRFLKEKVFPSKLQDSTRQSIKMVEFFGIFSSKVIPISSLRTGATWTKIPLVALRGQLLEKHYDQKPVKGYRHLWTNVSFYFVK